ncbi:aminoacyl-tRNA hydrolase [bacterium B17]|nr:aminoacyl-tRNA hydrolase [bacterium B17]
MKIIVGLGNPGSKYENTPHNVGFEVVDGLAGRWSCELRRSLRFKARQCRTEWKGNDLLLVKPQAYMNNSGFAVSAVMRYYKASPEDVIVIVDDADLEIGRIRIRPDGGTGGHRGLDSIVQHLHSKTFARVRIGIGKGGEGKNLVNHVLKRFSQKDREAMDKVTDKAMEAVLMMVESGVDTAMNSFNAAS